MSTSNVVGIPFLSYEQIEKLDLLLQYEKKTCPGNAEWLERCTLLTKYLSVNNKSTRFISFDILSKEYKENNSMLLGRYFKTLDEISEHKRAALHSYVVSYFFDTLRENHDNEKDYIIKNRSKNTQLLESELKEKFNHNTLSKETKDFLEFCKTNHAENHALVPQQAV